MPRALPDKLRAWEPRAIIQLKSVRRTYNNLPTHRVRSTWNLSGFCPEPIVIRRPDLLIKDADPKSFGSPTSTDHNASPSNTTLQRSSTRTTLMDPRNIGIQRPDKATRTLIETRKDGATITQQQQIITHTFGNHTINHHHQQTMHKKKKKKKKIFFLLHLEAPTNTDHAHRDNTMTNDAIIGPIQNFETFNYSVVPPLCPHRI